MKTILAALLPTLLCGCARTLIPLSPTLPAHPPPVGTLLEITARSAGVPTPLCMRGSPYAWDGLEETLGRTVAAATAPWADAHAAERPGGWQLIVELSQARVGERRGTVTVELGVRATLRTRAGHDYLAQTQVHCQRSMLVDASHAAPAFYGCMSSIGSELAGWLGGVTP